MEAQCIGDIEEADNEVKLRVGEVYKPPRAFQPCAIFCKDQLIPYSSSFSEQEKSMRLAESGVVN